MLKLCDKAGTAETPFIYNGTKLRPNDKHVLKVWPCRHGMGAQASGLGASSNSLFRYDYPMLARFFQAWSQSDSVLELRVLADGLAETPQG